MMQATPHSPAPEGPGRLELVGQVFGVEACRLVTGSTRMVVGRGAGCDLPLADPLVPGKAFRIRLDAVHEAAPDKTVSHENQQPGSSPAEGGRWILEPYPGARVCVNGHTVRRRELLRAGDIIAIGCHRLEFKPGLVGTRDCRLTVDVTDLCNTLIDRDSVPAALLGGFASHRDRLRGQRAALVGLGLAAVLAGLILLVPRDDVMETGGPIAVTLAPDRDQLPSAGDVRSLETVDRKSVDAPAQAEVPVELSQPGIEPAADMRVAPLNTVDLAPATPAPQLSRTVEDAGPNLGQLAVVAPSTQAVQFTRDLAKLGATTAARRVAVREEKYATQTGDLGQPSVNPDKGLLAAAISTSASDLAASRVAAPQLARVMDDAGPKLERLAVAAPGGPAQQFARDPAGKLGATTALRRVAMMEGKPALQGENLGQSNVKTDKGLMAANVSTRFARAVTDRRAIQPEGKLDAGRAENLAALTYKASRVTFQQYLGTRIPIARVPEQLSSLTAPKAGIELDGFVSDDEAAMSFKTGRFRLHAPGNPPEGSPATYCFISKKQLDGKDYLYVGFRCADPNLGALVIHESAGAALCWDDSVEIFLDVNADRVDYHHIIINARGNIFAQYCRNGEEGINAKGAPWNSGTIVKTSLQRERGEWHCEALIPYANLPQIPNKGAEIPFNVCRNFRGQKSKEPLQNWFTVYENSSNYHHPRLFGKLIWP